MVTLTGCVAGIESGSGSSPTEKYRPETNGNDGKLIEDEPKELLLTAGGMPSDGWRYKEEYDWLAHLVIPGPSFGTVSWSRCPLGW